MKKEENKAKTKQPKTINNNSKIRMIIVILFAILVAIVSYVIMRGKYLQVLEIGQNYTEVFWTNVRIKTITIFVTFLFVYTCFYLTNRKIQKCLKAFFDDEKREMPKLINKSISFILSIIISVITSNVLMEKAILFFNATSFGIKDDIFGNDIGYYLFQQPFIELVLMYALILLIGLTVYAGIYYIVVLNTSFDGVKTETLKNGKIVGHLLTNAKILSIILAILVFVGTQDLSSQKFLTVGEDISAYALYGAGFTDIMIKIWGYRILSIVIIISVFLAISYYRKKQTKKVIKSILIVPIYLLLLGTTMFGYNYLFVESNQLDKQKNYIGYNIEYTKNAYNINIEQQQITNGGTIASNTINKNLDLLNNISITNENLVLQYLNGTLTNKGYYTYSTTQVGIYNVDGKDTLLYIAPREILSTSSTYDNKTYEYTHGYGAVVVSASSTGPTGNLEILQKSVTAQEDSVINISQPRIYFGLETEETVVTNSTNKQEFDYLSTDATNTITTNSYDGTAGLQLGLLDRIILGMSQGDIKLAISSNVDGNSKILTNRNIIERAKKIMPYLMYDENPYLVVTDDGRLVWVLDAYTTSSTYPYSQKTTINNNYINKTELNYIRNSVKVLIDAYNGTVEFYITDRTDPIVMAYRNAYPELFQDLEKQIPEDISKHFVYPEYLYSIQAGILKRYHESQPDVIYRATDVWDIATYSEGVSDKTTITQVSPYYIMLKTVDSNENRLGLVLPYTILGKQNIASYLVGTYKDGKPVLKLYKFSEGTNVLGTMQLDTQIEQNEAIHKEIRSLNVTGTKLTKNIAIIPVDDMLLYVESIYQQYINETDSLPTLKKVVVASGNKVAIGDDFKSALVNLASQYAINIEIINTDNIDDLIKLIIKANKNLEESTNNNDWEMMGKDLNSLQELINKLEVLVEENEKKQEQAISE